eukprot:g8730.t1
MDFVAQTSDRSGLLLRKIGQRLISHLDAVSNAPVATSDDSRCTARSRGAHQELVQQQQQQQHRQHQHQHQQLGHHAEQHLLVEPAFPLGHTPDDVRPNIMSFLPARELSSVRRVSREFLLVADLHAEALWGRLCRHDFPSVTPPRPGAGGQGRAMLSPHQQYVKNVMHRAIDEAGNLRANHRLRESLDNFTWPIAWPAELSTTTIYSAITSTFGNGTTNNIRGDSSRRNDGVIGLLSDLVTVPDVRIARALSHKRRAALSTVVVEDDDIVFDFRRRGIHTGPVNFLPLSMLRQERRTPLAPVLMPLVLPQAAGNPAAAAAELAGERSIQGRDGAGGEDDEAGLLPLSPESPAPAGFLGYAVRLLRLRPEHESLRWTVLFAVFKDLVVFETTEQAEAVRARVPDRRLFYCALDHPGAQDDPCPHDGRSLPHISHWGFQRVRFGQTAGVGAGGGGGGGVVGVLGSTGETVGDAVERQERTACFARSSLAFLQYGGGGGVGRGVLS